MTFRWSDLDFAFDTFTFRYLNDLTWYSYSLIGMIPEFIILFYKLYIYFYKKQNYLQGKKQNKMPIEDKIMLIFTFYAPIYYLIDGVISLVDGSALTPCRFSYFFHHVVSITVQPLLLCRFRYDWWDISVCAFHSLLMFRPDLFWLNYLYVSQILIFNIMLYMPEQRKHPFNRFIGKLFPFIYYCFLLVLLNKQFLCDSSMPYLAE